MHQNEHIERKYTVNVKEMVTYINKYVQYNSFLSRKDNTMRPNTPILNLIIHFDSKLIFTSSIVHIFHQWRHLDILKLTVVLLCVTVCMNAG